MEPNTPEVREVERPIVKRDTELKPHALISASILLASIIIAGSILYGGGHSAGTAVTDTAPAAADTKTADISKVRALDINPYIGKIGAPVIMAYWSDFQCPFCKRNEQDVLPQIIKNYVDTGKVRIIFEDFAFLGNDSLTAAEYGRAVWELYPDKYYSWREAMFNAQDAEGDTGFGNAASIDKLDATIPDLDATKIKNLVEAKKGIYDGQISGNKEDGTAEGIQGTPGTVIGKTLIPGAYPYDTFKNAIDAALK